jgi:putative ABC transport system ATP-binding protein
VTVRLLPDSGWPGDKGQDSSANTLQLPAREVTSQKRPPIIELEAIALHGTRPPPGSGRHRKLPGGENLNLTVWPGELVMLTGRPRSGRSALLNVLGLLDRPVAGRYLLNGTDTARLRDREASALRGRLIGFVFQRKMLLPTRSVLDNVMLPLRYAGPRGQPRVKAALDSLDRVGLADRAQLMTWQLSAGELARCALARALVTKPSLLLCDEPTAGAEPPAAAQIIGLLAALHREGTTVIVATDDQLAAAYSSRTVQLGQPAPAQPAPAQPAPGQPVEAGETAALTPTVISPARSTSTQAGSPP